MPTMIFHAPYALNRRAHSASGIRPVRMHDAFIELGYEVIAITGNAAQRRARIKELRERIARGETIDFLYSESATMPTMLTDPRHLPPHPLVDLQLFRLCAQQKIPTGLFYRDIYWVFDSYEKLVGKAVAIVMRRLFRYDLRWYSRYLDVLYLPSLHMGKHVPIYPSQRMKALPPGANTVVQDPPAHPGSIHLLYIGGLGSHYQLHETVKAVSAVDSAHLTICTREQEWEKVRAEYESMMSDRIHVVHLSGDSLNELYAQADICSLMVKPDEYRTFASPVKLYEYLGYGKPVIASEGTLSGTFVEDNDCGWVLPYDGEAMVAFLQEISNNRAELAQMTATVKSIHLRHTWRARAQQVADELTAQRG